MEGTLRRQVHLRAALDRLTTEVMLDLVLLPLLESLPALNLVHVLLLDPFLLLLQTNNLLLKLVDDPEHLQLVQVVRRVSFVLSISF